MKLWATHDAAYAEVDVAGDREGLQALATAALDDDAIDLVLDAPPDDWKQYGVPLETIRIEPRNEGESRISFSHEGAALVIGGAPAELARVVSSSLASLAQEPASKNAVPTHVHLDPTTDPEAHVYVPGSLSIVVGFVATERP